MIFEMLDNILGIIPTEYLVIRYAIGYLILIELIKHVLMMFGFVVGFIKGK